MGTGTCLEWLSPLGKSSASLVELKNWMPMHSKKKKKKAKSRGRAQSWWIPSQAWEARVECPWHEATKQKKMHRYLLSPTRFLLLVFFDLFKVSKITTKFFTCSKSAKILRSSHPKSSHSTRGHPKRMTNFNYDLDFFKVSKITNYNYDLFKVRKITNYDYDLFKVRKRTNYNYDLFKVNKWLTLIMTCSKSAKWLKQKY